MHQPIAPEDVERFERMNRNLLPNTAKACLDGSLGIAYPAKDDARYHDTDTLGEPSEYVLKVYSPCARCGFIGYKLQGHKLCPRCESEYDIMGEEDCLVRRDNG